MSAQQSLDLLQASLSLLFLDCRGLCTLAFCGFWYAVGRWLFQCPAILWQGHQPMGVLVAKNWAGRRCTYCHSLCKFCAKALVWHLFKFQIEKQEGSSLPGSDSPNWKEVQNTLYGHLLVQLQVFLSTTFATSSLIQYLYYIHLHHLQSLQVLCPSECCIPK